MLQVKGFCFYLGSFFVTCISIADKMDGATERQPLLQSDGEACYRTGCPYNNSTDEVPLPSTGQIQDNVLMIKVYWQKDY